MFRRTDDLRIRDVRPLIPPAILLEEIPITEQASNLVFETRMTLMNNVVRTVINQHVMSRGPAYAL